MERLKTEHAQELQALRGGSEAPATVEQLTSLQLALTEAEAKNVEIEKKLREEQNRNKFSILSK